MRSITSCLALALLTAAVGCGGGGGDGDGGHDGPQGGDTRCAGVACSGHGVCAIENGGPVCRCADGFAASGLACNPVSPGGAGACTLTTSIPGADPVVACVAYTGSAWVAADVSMACGRMSSTYIQATYSAACGTDGLLGRCRMQQGQPQEVYDSYYEATGLDAADLARVCASGGGQWIEP